MDQVIAKKLEVLKKIIEGYKKVLIAFSGGLDSAYLLKNVIDILGGENVLAVTAFSQSLSPQELREALMIVEFLNARHLVILTNEFNNPDYLKNSPDRCFFCKNELFTKLKRIALSEGIETILYGAIADDEGDYRPGMIAAREQGIQSPLQQARLTKLEIRELAKDLPIWDKPASPCLSSRLPYGETITPEKLEQVDRAEKSMKDLGFRIVRVRHHGSVARIELNPEQISVLANPSLRERILKELKEIGYTYIAIDLEGYRHGSLNAELNLKSTTI